MEKEPVFNTIWATGQKSYSSFIRMADSLQQHLLSRDCSKSLHGHSSFNDAETLYNNTSFQGIALKVFMVIPALMMQKSSAQRLEL